MSIRVELAIPVARDEVWSRLADLESHSSWMRDAVAVEFLGDSRTGRGTRMRVPTRVGPFRTVDVLEVTSWVEGRSIGVVHEGLVTGTGEFRLEGDDPTSVIWEEQLEFPWWLGGRLTAFLAAPVLRWFWIGNLRRFAAGFDL